MGTSDENLKTAVDVPESGEGKFTWDTLMEELCRGSLSQGLRRMRTESVFHGLSSVNYRLDTTLLRMNRQQSKAAPPNPRPDRMVEQVDEKWPTKSVELNMIRNFRKYAHREMPVTDNFWVDLSVARHHNLPTRLLDWTNSPLVALHFATCDLQNFWQDGAVWAVRLGKILESVPGELTKPLPKGAIAFTVEELVEGGLRDLTYFEKLTALPLGKFMVFFEPPSANPRITSQYAVLSMMSDAEADPQDWLEHLGRGACRRIVIPKELKPEIRDRLDMMNITERTLAPGLDGLADWMRRYYGPSRWDLNLWKSFCGRMNETLGWTRE